VINSVYALENLLQMKLLQTYRLAEFFTLTIAVLCLN